MTLTLVYPSTPFWRAEVSRLALHLGGIAFENRHLSFEAFQRAKEAGELPFGQVPVLIVDGETIAQTGAIARFCGKLSGLYPTDDALAAARIDQFIDAATDITSHVRAALQRRDPEDRATARKVLIERTLPEWLGYLEVLCPDPEGAFLVGDAMTIADLTLWRLVRWLAEGSLPGVPTTILDGFPRLQAHAQQLDADPRIAAWMKQYATP